jgi:hypothetical protein
MPWNPQEYIIPLLGGSDKVEAPLFKNIEVNSLLFD